MAGLVAAVIVVAFLALMIVIVSKGSKGKGKSGKQKTRAQIIRDANRKLAQDAHNPEGLIPLGELYFRERAWDKAYPLYETMMNIAAAHQEIDPYLASIRYGICALRLNKLQESFKGLMLAYKARSDNFEVNYYLGQAFFQNKEYDKAVPLLKKATLLNPEASGLSRMLGMALYQGKHFREALPLLKKALDEKPDDKEALFSMADAMQESSYGEKAIKVFMHLRPDPEFGAKSCLSAGMIHEKQGDPEKAMQDYEIGLKHQNAAPEVAIEIRYRLANICFKSNNIAQGLAYVREIQAVNPTYKDVATLSTQYSELNSNHNLQIYLMSASSDFVALCRKFVMGFHAHAVTKIHDISVQPDNVEIMIHVETMKWESNELFRFYRSTGVVGELFIRDLHGKLTESKADKGICITAGTYSDEAKKYADGRPIDLYDKNTLVKMLKKIDLA